MSDGWPLVQLVDRVPTSSSDVPAVLFNMNAAPMQVDHENFSLGQPGFDGEPESVGVEDSWRQINAQVSVYGDYTTAAASLSSLARVLARTESVVLKYQHGSGNKPTYFALWRSQLPELVWDEVSSKKGKWTLPVTLQADPFGYGPRESVGPVTITNDPAGSAGNNPCFYVHGAIKGDVPTPAIVRIDPSIAWDGYTPFMASAALDPSQTPTVPIFWQTNGFTAGTDTTHDGAAGSTYSGGNRSSVTFATATAMTTRLSGAAPSTPSPGTYKVFIRCVRSDTSTTFAVRMGQLLDLTYTYPNDKISMTRAASPASNHAVWLDLGEFTLPFGANDLKFSDTIAGTTPDVSIQVERLSGTGTVYLDCLMLVPVDTLITWQTRQLFSRFFGFGVGTNFVGQWDGQDRRFLLLAFGTTLAPVRPPRLAGDWLTLWPGATNIFHLLHQTMPDSPTFTSTGNSDAIADTASVTFQYYPRYLHLRPDAD